MKAKPFLKWAGGKSQIAKIIESVLPLDIKESKLIDKYFEPFVGGGAIFFYLISEYKIKQVYLGDLNSELILTYNVVKKAPNELISKLDSYSENYLPLNLTERKEFYYNIRDEFNENLKNFDYENFSEEHIVRASQMIFLNRTCFNGLYRVNKSGKFNVPIGSYKKPLISDEKNILNVSSVLKNVEIICADYSKSEVLIDENSFVYLDPPYLPIKKTSFTNYNSNRFDKAEQIKLSKFCKRIDNKNAKFILSNSSPPDNFFEILYGNLNLKHINYKQIEARRFINSNSDKRGKVEELLIFNY